VASAAASAPAVLSPVSINAEMVRVVDHAAHQLWNAEKREMTPKTDVDWENIVEHATQVAAGSRVVRSRRGATHVAASPPQTSKSVLGSCVAPCLAIGPYR
jgi:hypothetical protein